MYIYLNLRVSYWYEMNFYIHFMSIMLSLIIYKNIITLFSKPEMLRLASLCFFKFVFFFGGGGIF